MALNIKNEEVERLAHEVAGLAGESLTAAVATALKERLARLQPISAEAILAIGRECAAHLTPETLALDHGEYLYDDMGRPK